MNKEQLTALLVRDKIFLKSLYEANSALSAKNILMYASDSKLNTLIKFLHFVSVGEIKVKKEHFDSLEKKHLTLVKKFFEKKSTVLSLLNDERQKKILILVKFKSVFHELLFTLFNLIC